MENEFKILDNALVYCKVNMPEVIIPNGVTSICSYAFSKPDDFHGQNALKSVVIPKSVVSIEEGAFKYCKNLKKVTILGAAAIESEAFLSCSNLEEVYLADEVKSIGSQSFAYCEKLKYLYIPKGVAHIGWDIAGMNDSSYHNPVFRCYRKGNGADWDDDWNRIYNDPRFGNDRSHHYFHTTYYGVNRDGTPRQGCELVHIPCTDMPHGTGQKATENKSLAESRRMPKAKLKLWLTATVISMVDEKEYLLDDEEREMLPHMLRDNDEHIEHQLDEPWVITIDDSTGHLAPELKISAWINNFDDIFDGKTIVVHHDMPWHNDPYSDYPVSLLTMGGTVIAEKHLTFGITTYDVRLHIQWVEEEYKTYTKKEALADMQQSMVSYKDLKDSGYEIDVLLAHGQLKAEKYKTYKPSVFLTQFPADLDAEGDKWGDLGQIVIQRYFLYEETHSYSDDYKDAAEAYGEDCDDWTTIERRKSGDCVTYEISEA
ncbi:MAG: leucine-rich repeat domain-containing protein [Bacteroidales bacterium]|nr:leucine-rich repeat domain-containing protein [Bacteroidales bacterium]